MIDNSNLVINHINIFTSTNYFEMINDDVINLLNVGALHCKEYFSLKLSDIQTSEKFNDPTVLKETLLF